MKKKKQELKSKHKEFEKKQKYRDDVRVSMAKIEEERKKELMDRFQG